MRTILYLVACEVRDYCEVAYVLPYLLRGPGARERVTKRTNSFSSPSLPPWSQAVLRFERCGVESFCTGSLQHGATEMPQFMRDVGINCDEVPLLRLLVPMGERDQD